MLLSKRIDDVHLFCLTEAAWAMNTSNWRSRTGVLISLNGSSVLWTSKHQSLRVLSTVEARFNAFVYSIKKLKWLQILLMEIMSIKYDSIQIKHNNLVSKSRTQRVNQPRNVRHIALKYRFVRDAVKSKFFVVWYTTHAENLSDSLIMVMNCDEFCPTSKHVGVAIKKIMVVI